MRFIFPALRRSAVAAALSVPVVAGAFVWKHPALLTAAELFRQVVQTLSTQYVDTLPMDSLYLRAARGLVHEFHDPYTQLFTPAEGAKFMNSVNGKITGIGVRRVVDRDGVYIAMVLPGTPAAGAGLRVGDKVIQVDTTPFGPGITGEEVSAHITGPVGTTVHMTVVRAGARPGHPDTLQVTMTRAAVRQPGVPFTVLLDGHVGYIPVQQFSEGVADEVHAALDTLRRAGAVKFILDLRDNPGGMTDEAVSLCGLFLGPEHVVLRRRERSGEDVSTTPPIPAVAPSEPLVVLVNPHTASAAEITSGALQDHDRAVIVGQSTYGKGVGQDIRRMPDGYILKVTSMRWYTPVGRSVQRERRLLPDGEYVETHPDSLETDAERRARPTYKSDLGRTLYGGDGITPDLVLRDTVATGGARFMAAIKPNVWRVESVLSDYAASLSRTMPGDGHVTPAMRAAFLRHLRLAKIALPKAVVAQAEPFLDRLIAERVALVRGDLAQAKRAEAGNDGALVIALKVLRQANTQADLWPAVQHETAMHEARHAN